jgi:hypothetical protein
MRGDGLRRRCALKDVRSGSLWASTGLLGLLT